MQYTELLSSQVKLQCLHLQLVIRVLRRLLLLILSGILCVCLPVPYSIHAHTHRLTKSYEIWQKNHHGKGRRVPNVDPKMSPLPIMVLVFRVHSWYGMVGWLIWWVGGCLMFNFMHK